MAVRSADVSVASLQDLRVLIVDDEPRLAEVLARLLTLEGWQARSTLDGLGALRVAAQFRPHAVVLDIGLPDIDGFEVLRRLARPYRAGGNGHNVLLRN